jgi:sucrose-6-phosphate hydrolase SacC (GH32 family)
LFELAVEGSPRDTRWVFWAGNGNYLLGRFDGKTFIKESGPHPSEWGANFYAAQSYSDIPPADGRRIQIAWMRGGQYPGMPFNQQMSFPCELTLRKFSEGVRLCRNPVRELEKLRREDLVWKNLTLRPGEKPLQQAVDELLEVRGEFEPGAAGLVELRLRGETILYDAKKKEIQCRDKTAGLETINGRVQLQVLVDRTSLELFANAGQRCMSFCVPLEPKQKSLELSARGDAVKVPLLTVHELGSVWGKAE